MSRVVSADWVIPVEGEPIIPTNEQTESMAAYLADNWAKAVG